MKIIIGLALGIVLFAGSAHAGENQALANELTTMLGSEEACGLHYNHDAIERFMTEHFKPNDDIYSDLTIMAAANKREAEETTASTRVALCAQVRRAAKHYGFIQ